MPLRGRRGSSGERADKFEREKSLGQPAERKKKHGPPNSRRKAPGEPKRAPPWVDHHGPLSPELEEGARAFVSRLVQAYGPEARELREAARVLADADAAIRRVRGARLELLGAMEIRHSDVASRQSGELEMLDTIIQLERYEQRSRRRRGRAITRWLLTLEAINAGQGGGHVDHCMRSEKYLAQVVLWQNEPNIPLHPGKCTSEDGRCCRESSGQMATRNRQAADPRTNRLANNGEPRRSLIMGQTLYKSVSRIRPVADSEGPVSSWNFRPNRPIWVCQSCGIGSMSGLQYKQLLQGRGIDAPGQDNIGGINEPQACNRTGYCIQGRSREVSVRAHASRRFVLPFLVDRHSPKRRRTLTEFAHERRQSGMAARHDVPERRRVGLPTSFTMISHIRFVLNVNGCKQSDRHPSGASDNAKTTPVIKNNMQD